jgi:hypothetical protein
MSRISATQPPWQRPWLWGSCPAICSTKLPVLGVTVVRYSKVK